MKQLFDVVEIKTGNVVESFENKMGAKKKRDSGNPLNVDGTRKIFFKVSKGKDHWKCQ